MIKSLCIVAASIALVLACFAGGAAARGIKVANPDTIECNACHFIVGFIEGDLKQNNTVANIEKVLDEVCLIMPKSLQPACVSLISTYFSELVAILLKDENVDTACNQLGLCQSNDVAASAFQEAVAKYVAHALHNVEPSSDECLPCELVVKYADTELSSNATQAEVISFVESACSILPSTVRTECDAFIAKYGPQLMDELAAELQPLSICTAIGACDPKTTPAPTKAVAKPVEEKPVFMSTCSICEFVVAAAEDVITNNSTESEIEKYLDDACNILGKYSSLCTGFINQYLPTIFSDLVNGEAPETVCASIKVCPSAPSPSASVSSAKKPPVLGGKVTAAKLGLKH